MRKIWFIRHGQSESNAGLATMYPGGSALTELGKTQARYVAQTIPTRPDLIITSPYIRTKQTAIPTFARFTDVPHEEWPVQEFHYLALPTDRPIHPDERRPLVDAYWERCDPFYRDGPQTETFANFAERAHEAQTRLLERTEEYTIVFTHGLFTRLFLWLLLTPPAAMDAMRMRRFLSFIGGMRVPNTAIIKFQVIDAQLYTVGISMPHLTDEHLSW
jgi:broad specificity phosphatase PhoE